MMTTVQYMEAESFGRTIQFPKMEAAEMAQQLRAKTALSKDLRDPS